MSLLAFLQVSTFLPSPSPKSTSGSLGNYWDPTPIFQVLKLWAYLATQVCLNPFASSLMQRSRGSELVTDI